MSPKIAKAMNSIAVITGRLIAKRVNHTVQAPSATSAFHYVPSRPTVSGARKAALQRRATSRRQHTTARLTMYVKRCPNSRCEGGFSDVSDRGESRAAKKLHSVMSFPEIRGLCPLIEVFDMMESVGFYCDALGFEIARQSP